MDIISWGIRCDHHRYRCNNCGTCFIKHREDVSKNNRLVWFREWVLGKQSLSDIAAESGYSERQLRRWFAEYLDNVPSSRRPSPTTFVRVTNRFCPHYPFNSCIASVPLFLFPVSSREEHFVPYRAKSVLNPRIESGGQERFPP